MKIYYSSSIDVLDDKGEGQREQFKKILKDAGHEVLAPGMNGAPILDLNSPIEDKEKIVKADLELIDQADTFLAVTDLKTFSVGMWMECWHAKQNGKNVLAFVKSDQKVKNLFLEVVADKIVYNSTEKLCDELKKLGTEEL